MKVDELESRHRSSVLRAQACYPLVLQFQCGDQTNPSDKKSYPKWLRLSEVILIMIHWILVDQFIVPIRSNNCSLLGPVNLWISRCYFLGVCKPARVSRTSMQGGLPKIANLVYNFVNWGHLGSMEERINIVTVIRVYKPTRITLGHFVPKPSTYGSSMQFYPIPLEGKPSHQGFKIKLVKQSCFRDRSKDVRSDSQWLREFNNVNPGFINSG